MTRNAMYVLWAATCMFVLSGTSSARAVCGDVNASGDVTATDALVVLNEAVGLNPDLACDTEFETRVSELERSASPIVRDREGAEIGVLVLDIRAIDGLSLVVRDTVQQRQLRIDTYWGSQGELINNPSELPFFATPDCSGPAYVDTSTTLVVSGSSDTEYRVWRSSAPISSPTTIMSHIDSEECILLPEQYRSTVTDMGLDQFGNAWYTATEVELTYMVPIRFPITID